MKSYKDLRLELAGALLAFVAGVVGAVLDRFGVPFQTYLPVIVGLLITATVSLLKVELMARIDRDSRIQSLLDQLEHNEEIAAHFGAILKLRHDPDWSGPSVEQPLPGLNWDPATDGLVTQGCR